MLGAAATRDDFLGQLANAARAEDVPACELDQPEPADELMAQIPLTARLQLLASRRADAGGHDPDLVITGAWDDERLWATGAPGRTAEGISSRTCE